jgi:hypothetical protein
MSQSYPVQWKAVAGICASIAVLSGLVALVLSSFEMASAPSAGALPGAEQSVGFPPALIATVTCIVSTVSAFSSLWLNWRADRRQSREMELKFAQLQIELERERQHPSISN